MSGLLIPNNFDPKNKNKRVAVTDSTSTTYYNVVSISGKGYLMSISQSGATDTTTVRGYIKIVVDGITVYDGVISCLYRGGTLAMMPIFRFENSLLVQTRVTAETQLVTNATYLLD